MKLQKCHIENFGRLQDVTISFSEGLNTFQEENGWGKSTLAVFLKVMLYGFANENKRSVMENERKRYKPWQGGVFGGQLWFEVKGKEYELDRTFGSKTREDTFTLYDANTGVVCNDYSPQIGMELFQLDAPSFARTVFLAQQECMIEVTDGIHAKLGNLVREQEDIGQYDQAQKCLMELWNKWTPTRKTGMLSRLQKDITELEAKNLQWKNAEKELEMIRLEKGQRKEQVDHLWKEQENLQKKQAQEVKWQARKAQKEWYERLCAQVQKKQESYESACASFSRKVPSKEEVQQFVKWSQAWERLQWRRPETTVEENGGEKADLRILYVGAALMLLGLLLWLFQSEIGAVTGMAGAVLFLGGVLYQKGKRGVSGPMQPEQSDLQKLKDEAEKLEKEMQHFLTYVGYRKSQETSYPDLAKEMEQQWEKCAYKREELCQAKEEQQKFEQDHAGDLTMHPQMQEEMEPIRAVEEVQAQIRAGEAYLQQLGQREVELRKQMEERDKREETLKQLFIQQEKLEHQYEVVSQTKQLLEEAKENLTVRYRNPVEEAFRGYYEQLTHKKAQQIEMDANLTLRVRKKGEQREMELFSAGTKDLAGICMRLALIDAMYQGEQPFLVLDDPFVNLDEATLQHALEFLHEIARKRQILYFTCHSSRT